MEYINISNGIEQNVIISYGLTRYNFKIRFNDYFEYWYFDLYLYDTDTLVLAGIKLKLIYDCFEGLGLNLGKLYLEDTINDGSTINIKTDFGKRLKLLRDYTYVA